MKSFTIVAIALGASFASAAPGSKPDRTYPGPGCPAPTRTPTTTAKPPVTTPPPSGCAITTTHTWYAGKSAGCRFDPAGDFCVIDTILTLPCGCTKATNLEEHTTTVCAKTDKAVNCHVGYMFTTTATNC